MTVSAIVTNATQSVVSRYPSEAGPIVARLKSDLDAHIASVAEALIEGGTALGAQREQIEGLLVDAGLVEPTPEPEPVVEAEPEHGTETVTPGSGRKSQRIAALETAIGDLGTKVDALVRLAESRLGARIS